MSRKKTAVCVIVVGSCAAIYYLQSSFTLGVHHSIDNSLARDPIDNKLKILKLKHDINIPKLRLSIRVLIKILEDLEKEDAESKKVFFKYIGTDKKFLKDFKKQIKSIKQWWESKKDPLTYDKSKNGAHGTYRYTISIGPRALTKPVIQNDRGETSIVATLFHESTHTVLGFPDFSTKVKDQNIEIADIHRDSKHGHYLNPGQCEHVKKYNNPATLKNPQCWEHAFITKYAYLRMCKPISNHELKKYICSYSSTQQEHIVEKWLERLIFGLRSVSNNQDKYPSLYKDASLLLEKKFSLLITSESDECQKHEKFHGNHKNIVVCNSFDSSDIKDLTKFFFEKLEDCNSKHTCLPNHERFENLSDLSGQIQYIMNEE